MHLECKLNAFFEALIILRRWFGKTIKDMFMGGGWRVVEKSTKFFVKNAISAFSPHQLQNEAREYFWCKFNSGGEGSEVS